MSDVRRYDKYGKASVLTDDKIKIGKNVEFGSNVRIDAFCWIGNNVVIEDNVIIKPFCYIEDNSIIKKDSILEPYTHIKNNPKPETKVEKVEIKAEKKEDDILSKILGAT